MPKLMPGMHKKVISQPRYVKNISSYKKYLQTVAYVVQSVQIVSLTAVLLLHTTARQIRLYLDAIDERQYRNTQQDTLRNKHY